MRTPILCSIAVAAITALMLPACGGDVTSGGSNDTCPPGSACPPDCTSGAPCSDAASDAPAQPIGDDASTSLDANYPAGSVPPTSATVSALAYGVVDAKYSTALSSIVIVSATPTSALHLYDVTTASDRSVALPEAPVAVAVAPNGLTAAVAFDAQVSLVDLTSGTITTTCAVSSDAYDVALSSTGIAYVLPHTGGDVPVHAIDFSSCNEVLGGVFSAPSRIALHPSEQALFIAEQGLYPSRILRCDVSSSPAECVDSADDADWGTYETCGNLWISADGARIYSACGVTISVPANVTADPCSFAGTLDGVTEIQHLSEAPQVQRVVLIPGLAGEDGPSDDSTPPGDMVIRVHETQSLGLAAQYDLPPFPLPDGTVAIAHGRFVFTSPTMDTLYVVVQADPSSEAPNDFAIATIVP